MLRPTGSRGNGDSSEGNRLQLIALSWGHVSDYLTVVIGFDYFVQKELEQRLGHVQQQSLYNVLAGLSIVITHLVPYQIERSQCQ